MGTGLESTTSTGLSVTNEVTDNVQSNIQSRPVNFHTIAKNVRLLEYSTGNKQAQVICHESVSTNRPII